MPGQYKHLCRILAENPENEVVFLTKPKPKVSIPNVTKVEYEIKREPSPETHRYLIPFERGVFAGQEIWRVCKQLKLKGFTPDVIVGHLGWGEGMFLKDIFHDVPVLTFMEYFYSAYGADVAFLEEEKNWDDDNRARIRMKNALHFFNLEYSDWCITPTWFQLERHPKEYHGKFSVLHDGIDTDVVKPPEQLKKKLSLPNGVTLGPEDEIITYISRNFEPYRGFPQFMRAAEQILKERPKAHIIMVGQDGVSYGTAPENGKTWRQVMMEEVSLDESRFHVLGFLPHEQMVQIMHHSQAHIYLTVPFVLSWSMMESMAAGCLLIASDTEPVREVVTHEENGLLVDFFSQDELVAALHRASDHQDELKPLRQAARQTVLDRYALDKVMPLHIQLVEDLARGQNPPDAAEAIRKFDLATRKKQAKAA
ncbi:MAG: glycosyltransferase [Rickettsiales bacterium]|nr:glycosyltransferase [Rickettsiales bacterium]